VPIAAGGLARNEDIFMVAKIEYDGNLRTFKLVDSEFRIVLEGDGFLDVGIPLTFEEFEWDDRASDQAL
jgi:hypothetical protein